MITRSVHCGRCGAQMPEGNSPLAVIGPPFATCPGCGTLNVSKTISEWDHKTAYQKASHLATLAFMVVVMGGLLGFGAVSFLGPSVGLKATLAQGQAGAGVGILIGAGWAVYSFRAQVAASRARLMDPAYLAQLRKLGLP